MRFSSPVFYRFYLLNARGAWSEEGPAIPWRFGMPAQTLARGERKSPEWLFRAFSFALLPDGAFPVTGRYCETPSGDNASGVCRDSLTGTGRSGSGRRGGNAHGKKAALPVRSVFPEGFSPCVYSTTVNRTGLRGGTRAYWTEGYPSMSPAQILRPSGTGMPRSTPLPAAAITKPLQQVPTP